MPFNHVLAPDASHGFFERLTPAETTLYAFFDAVFTRNISSTFSDDYKLTAAIAKHLTTNFMPRPGFDIREDRSVGLRYSSVLNRESSFNVALKPKFAEERLQLCHLLEGRVIAIGEQGEPKLEILDNADHFLERTVVWSGDPNMIPLGIEDKNKVSFVTKNGQWTLPVYERPTTAEDIEEFVCEIFYQSAISGSK